MKKLVLVMIGLLLLGGWGGSSARPALAQGGPLCEWSEKLDFTQSMHGWNAISVFSYYLADWEAGRGFYMERAPDDYTPSIVGAIQEVNINFFTGSIFTLFTPTSVLVEYSITTDETIGDITLDGGGSLFQIQEVPDGTSSVFFSREMWNPSKLSTSSISIYMDIQEGDTPFEGQGSISSVTITGEGYNPFTGQDNCEVIARFTPTPESGVAPLEVDFDNDSRNAANYTWEFGDGNTSIETNPRHTFEYPGEYQVTLTAWEGIRGFSDSDTETKTITVIVDTAGQIGDLTKPLAEADELRMMDNATIRDYDESYLPGEPYIEYYPALYEWDKNSVLFIANNTNSVVHAGVAGSVGLRQLTNAECGIALGIQRRETPGDPSSPLIHDSAVEKSACAINTDVGELDNPIEPNGFDMSSVYLVTIYTETDAELSYLVLNADKYLYDGEQVEPGCEIGETIKFSDRQGVTIEIDPITFRTGGIISNPIRLSITIGASSPDTSFTAAWLTQGDESLALGPRFAEYPNPDEPCNVDPKYSDCLLDNPRMLSDGYGWQSTTTNVVTWENPGALLYTNADIFQTLNLDPEQTYTLTVFAKPQELETEAEIRLFAGLTSERIDITTREAGYTQYSIGPALFQTGEQFYKVGVQNVGETPVHIYSICISEDPPNTGARNCIFRDYSFGNMGDFWDASGVSFYPGEARFSDEGTIQQNIQLFPNDDLSPATYELIIIAGLWTREGDNSEAIAIKFKYPASSSFVTVGDSSSVTLTTNLFEKVTLRETFTISAQTTDPFTITAELFSGSSSDTGATIYSACIRTQDGSDPPGYDEGGGEYPPFPEKCEEVSQPGTTDVSSWIYWQWGKFQRFFECDLMVLLNKMYKSWSEFRTTALYSIRWSMESVRLFSTWLGQIPPYLNGHFANLARSGGTIIIGGDSLPDECEQFEWLGIFQGAACWLQNAVLAGLVASLIASLLATAAGAIGSVLATAATLAFTTLAALISALAIVIAIFVAFVSAWNNATPIPIPFIPDCGINEKTSVFCILMRTAEFTIFSGTGSVIIPMIIGFVSFNLLSWTVKQVRSFIEKSRSLM